MGKLEDKFALVTGGSRGIGRGIAIELAREGTHVAVNYRRDEAAARATVEEIERLGRRAFAVQADVAEWPAVSSMVAEVLDRFGRLDVVVANSGVASRAQAVWDVDVDHWHRVIAVDLHGAFYTCKASAKHLVDRGSGVIVLISSVGADMCGPYGSPYYRRQGGGECAHQGSRQGVRPGRRSSQLRRTRVDPDGHGRPAHGVPWRRVGQLDSLGSRRSTGGHRSGRGLSGER